MMQSTLGNPLGDAHPSHTPGGRMLPPATAAVAVSLFAGFIAADAHGDDAISQSGAEGPGETYYWDRSGGGRFGHRASWSPRGQPGADDTVIFDLDDNGQIEVRSDAEVFRLHLDHGFSHLDLGSRTLSVHAESDVLPSISVGRAAGDDAHLLLDGGVLEGHDAVVGLEAGSSALVELQQNAGWALDGSLQLGRYGEGKIDQSGGSVTVGGGLFLGTRSGGSGIYSLSGGSLTTNQLALGIADDSLGELHVGPDATWQHAGDVVIGQGGAGLLDVAGQSVDASRLTLGEAAAATGELRIGADSWWGSDEVTIGEAGTGVVEQSGGSFQINQTLIVGAEAGGEGILEVLGGNLVTQDVVLGQVSGARGELQLGSDAAWTHRGSLEIGSGGEGVLGLQGQTLEMDTLALGTAGGSGRVELGGGALLRIGDPDASDPQDHAYLGTTPDSHGEMEVAGFGSAWHVHGLAHIGYEGSGVATVRDRGSMFAAGTEVGQSAAAAGGSLLHLEGIGSDLTTGYVRVAGDSEVRVSDNAEVQTRYQMLVGSGDGVGRAVIDGGSWSGIGINRPEVYVGVPGDEGGEGELIIRNGGSLVAEDVFAGWARVGQTAHEANLLIENPGSELRVLGELIVGERQNAELTLRDGALLETPNERVFLGAREGGATVRVEGEGTRWDRHDTLLHVGTLSAKGTLTLTDGAEITGGRAHFGSYGEGALYVSGAGTRWATPEEGTRIGASGGVGEMIVSDGAEFEARGLAVGNMGGDGRVLITGPDTRALVGIVEPVPQSATVGNSGGGYGGGYGEIEVADGALFKVGSVLLGRELGDEGRLLVHGPGTELRAIGGIGLRMGVDWDDGAGVFHLSDAAHADVTRVHMHQGSARIEHEGTRMRADELNIHDGEHFIVEDRARLETNAASISASDGNMIMQLRGPQTVWHNDGLVTIGDVRSDGGLTVADGATLDTESLRLGAETEWWQNRGRLKIEGHGSSVNVADAVHIGYEGYPHQDLGDRLAEGVLEVRDGGSLAAATAWLGSANAPTDGVLDVSGDGSRVQIDDVLSMGHRGSGALALSDGASLESGRTHIGYTEDATGRADLTGDGTRWTVDHNLNIGGSDAQNGGSGEVYVGNGAELNVGGLVRLWSDGLLEIDDAEVQAEYVVSEGGTIVVEPVAGESGSSLSINQALALPNPSGRLHANVSSSDAFSFAAISAAGEAHLGGILSADLLEGAHLAPGDTLTLLEAGGIQGHFDQIETRLTDDLLLNVRYDESSVTLEARLAGDITGDQFVGGEDLDLLLSRWGESVTPGTVDLGDLTGDGFIGGADLDLLLANWGNQATLSEAYALVETRLAMTAVPEPGSFALALLGSGLLLRRHARSWRRGAQPSASV